MSDLDSTERVINMVGFSILAFVIASPFGFIAWEKISDLLEDKNKRPLDFVVALIDVLSLMMAILALGVPCLIFGGIWCDPETVVVVPVLGLIFIFIYYHWRFVVDEFDIDHPLASLVTHTLHAVLVALLFWIPIIVLTDLTAVTIPPSTLWISDIALAITTVCVLVSLDHRRIAPKDSKASPHEKTSTAGKDNTMKHEKSITPQNNNLPQKQTSFLPQNRKDRKLVQSHTSYRFSKETEAQTKLFNMEIEEALEKRKIKKEANIQVYQDEAGLFIEAKLLENMMKSEIIKEQSFQDILALVADMNLSPLEQQRLVQKLYKIRNNGKDIHDEER